MEKAWVLRTCYVDGTSYGGFRWPNEVGTVVKCTDWSPAPECGDGLHGLLDGIGDYSSLSNAPDAIWQIVEIDRESCVDLGGKVKFPECVLVYSGDMVGALTKFIDYQINYVAAASGGYSQLAASGNNGHLAASGDYSQLASSGDYCQLAASGDRGQLASSGNNGQLAASGDYSRLAASGKSTICVAAGVESAVSAGENGTIVLTWWNAKKARYEIEVGYIGENGLKPNTYYKLDDSHQFVEVGDRRRK